MIKHYLSLLCIPCIITARPVPKKIPSPQSASTSSSPASFELLSEPYNVLYSPAFSPTAILTPHEQYSDNTLESTNHSERSATPYMIPYTHKHSAPSTPSIDHFQHIEFQINNNSNNKSSPKKCVTPVDDTSITTADPSLFHAFLLASLKKYTRQSSQKPVDQWIKNITKLHKKDPHNTYIYEKWQKLAALKSRLSYKAPRPSQQRYFHPEVFNVPWRP